MTNAATSVYQSLTNLAVLNNGTNADITTTNVGNVFLPQTPEVFAYDADGNLTNDGRWSYSWDAENRLLSMISSNAVDAAKMKLEFNYDYKARRIEKKVSNWSGGTWQLSYDNRLLFDGWNVLGELNMTNNSLISDFLWGLDLSGDLQKLAGIGALLAFTRDGAGAHLAVYDGNGNVSGLVNSSSGTISAVYQYSSFGTLTVSTGAVASLNPFRFSTKYADETDMVYYGYRYYSSDTGRWLSRDPFWETAYRSFSGNNDKMAERGNPFLMVLNDPESTIDPVGLDPDSTGCKICREGGFMGRFTGHAWLECPFGSIGFWPGLDGIYPGGPGTIVSPDSHSSDPNKHCMDIQCDCGHFHKCRPCNPTKFQQCVQNQAQATPPDYNVLTYNCSDWAIDTVIRCMRSACYY